MSISTIIGAAHARTARLGISEVVRRLNAALGATFVAALAGSKDSKISYGWAQQNGPMPKPVAVKRLQFAFTQWSFVTESEHVARMWLIGSNPWLEHDSPIDAIRDDRFKDVAAAATVRSISTLSMVKKTGLIRPGLLSFPSGPPTSRSGQRPLTRRPRGTARPAVPGCVPYWARCSG
ncbi:hypothetical protein [Glutamicibacter arilaitensis]|uniref:hypothetical protein n=1 Tax=Glutamicibacter arilaitensis TaxID=256701 RepID=UPI00384D590D